MNEKIRKSLSNIKLLASDVDGVLTDGGLYYSESGLTFKKFNVKDGMAVRLLKEKGVYSALISTDSSDIPKMRAERLKMDFCITGSWDKLEKLKEICEELTISLDECAFIGDDVNDLEILNSVGLSFSPSDAVDSVRNSVDIVLKSKGGEGAFREAADLILSSK
ncbi:MAG: HAD-IIIA family hydrolase [Ignavibacteria bacterium]|nr:MAG: HAD-IIIA family hydrolase [Ignavibacteria bacterium]